MKLETQLSLKHEMSEALNSYDPVGNCINVARNFAQIEKSIVKEIVQFQSECLEQCAKAFDPNSPIGIQIRLTIEKSKSL